MAMKHNDVLVAIQRRNGIRERKALILKERLDGRRLEEFVTDYGNYVCGYAPPHYPVPAVIGEVVFDGYPGIVYINHPNGDDWVQAWDYWAEL